MKKTTIIPTVSVLIALVCAALFCLNWNPDSLLKGKEQPMTLSDIEQNLIPILTVSQPGRIFQG